MSLRSGLSWLILDVTLLGNPSVWAQDDSITLKASTSLTSDSNLFRLPEGTNTVQRLGKASAAEQISTISLGLTLSTRLSLQQLDVTVGVADNRYNNFDHLNYTATNYDASLKWSMTPSLHGTVKLDRAETLNSFSDDQGSSQRNKRTDINHRVNAIYDVDGPWHVLAGVSQFSQTNQQALPGSDFSSDALEAGLSYVFASGSSVTLNQKITQGQYVKQSNSDFGQNRSDLQLHWVLLGRSTADLSVGQFSQSHTSNAPRDFSGLNSAASLNWMLTGKSAIVLGQSRSLASYASNFSNYTQTDKLYLAPNWQISTRSLLRLRHEMAQIQYLGALGSAPTDQRKDFIHDTGLTFFWQPDQRLTLSAAIQNSIRSANQTGLDYDSSQVSISAQYSY